MIFPYSFFKSSGVSYDADALALFSRMSTPPTDSRKLLINQLILDLKSNNLWTKTVAMWMMASETSQAGTLNWINSSYTLTLMSSPTFTADRGFQTNGSTSYIKTGVIPSSVSGYSQDDGAYGIYVNTSVSENAVDMGMTGTHYCLLYSNLGGQFYSSMNDAGSTPSVAITSSVGLSALSRLSSANYKAYKDGVLKNTHLITSSGEPTVEFYIGGRNNAGTHDRKASKRYAFAFVSSGLTDGEMATFNTLVTNYLTTIGGN